MIMTTLTIMGITLIPMRTIRWGQKRSNRV
jgi:hypothetical protein